MAGRGKEREGGRGGGRKKGREEEAERVKGGREEATLGREGGPGAARWVHAGKRWVHARWVHAGLVVASWPCSDQMHTGNDETAPL